MNSLNSTLVEGNLVQDPALRTTPQGTPVCSFSIACDRFHRGAAGMEKEVSFFDIETWGKLAENAASVGRKGRGVRVVGRLKQERWANTEGKQQSKVLIVAEHLEFRPEINPHKGPEKEAETSEIER